MARFYLTTPIYYVNDKPHIGHAYTTVLADVLARYHRLFGDETFFLTGTDEHGQKVSQAAKKAGVTPQEHCDRTSARFREAWQALGITHDAFIRTTDPAHVAFVQTRLRELEASGDVYATDFEGWYSTSEERFFTEKELVDGKDPVSGRPVELVKEKNYFFRMSSYQKRLVDHIEEHSDFILPESRRNEVLGFLRKPLNDLCISRPKARVDWGISIPFDPDYTAYVWVDALLNYWSAVSEKPWADGSSRWPADLHLVGKDILTTHAVYWMTLLLAWKAPLPRHLLAHGWWLVDSSRMSKTTGNVVDPIAMAATWGADAFRYYLMRDMSVGQDASFSEEALVLAHNADLANDLGNLYSRAHRIVAANFGSAAPSPAKSDEADESLREKVDALAALVRAEIEAFRPDGAIKAVVAVLREMNRYVDAKAPWKLVKEDPAAAGTCVYRVLDGLRVISILLTPVMPEKMGILRNALGVEEKPDFEKATRSGGLPVGFILPPAVPLFPRIEWKKPDAQDRTKTVAPEAKAPEASFEGTISIDDFMKVKLVAAVILSAETVPGADKLLKLSVDAGEGTPRTVVAGIRLSYPAETVVGKRVLLVANLAPRKLKGIESRGMLLCAKEKTADGERLVLVSPEENVAPGSSVA